MSSKGAAAQQQMRFRSSFIEKLTMVGQLPTKRLGLDKILKQLR